MEHIIIMSLILVSIFTFKFCGKRESTSPETYAPTEYTYESVEESTTNGWLKNMSYVDSEIHSVIVSDDFQKANLDGRIKLMQDVMKQLVEEGNIENYQISTYNKNISYEYAGGGFGAVMLEEFPKDQN